MGLSGVMRLKPEICGSIDTITDSVELCDSTNGSLAQSNYNTTLSELDVDTNGLWMTVFGSIIIQTTGLLRTAFGHQEMVIQHTCFDEEQSIDYYYTDYKLMILMLKRVPSLPNTVQESPLKLLPHNTSSLLSFLSCINSIDTAPPPHDWFTGACHTAPLPSTGNGSLVCISPEPLSDSGKICDIEFVHADPNEICHRTGSTTDFTEFFCKSTNPPDPLIPVLPSYELSGLPASCATKPMTGAFSTKPPVTSLYSIDPFHTNGGFLQHVW
ncbi:hypothetical protein NDA11_005787 [Ustilago hordei]|uniref:Uncharacterized protein n=1 Tax=Ustilago hordei TaxID=120017 RepID=I2FSU5_USTHO|nr:hypothetical protein NDA10_000232 [Ustilago hordei]KAJ1570931.1 hypothetical protein NDA11_005787 [Ustilago hordei]KAJ1587260.1 hypothetical protein NDA15_003769 [Ustilago hordei]KAJ1590182.1 hypothetical protein NDA12_004848 [Ustilago hordei]UTT96608.1 hypothetical protein NDA17_000593 [Ustilago hordei]